jgi:predicted SprT family Zn-dependent metalloprotease
VHLEEMYAEVPTNNVRNSPEAGRFVRKLWDYLNREKFQSRMKAPNFILTKDMGENMRRRGYWSVGRRVIGLSPRLFNGHQNFFVEVLLHEMCHQAVSEIDHVIENVNKGHGPTWQKWMRKVGLNPLRYDPTPNSEFMKEGERKAHEQKMQKIREGEHQNMKKLQQLSPVYNPTAGMLVKGVWNGEQIDGALAYPYGRGWTVMERPYQMQMKVVQLDKLFKHPNPEKMDQSLSKAAIDAFHRNEERLQRRKDRSALRKGLLPWDHFLPFL